MKYIFGFFYRNSLPLLHLAIASIKPFWPNTIIIDNTPAHDLTAAAGFPAEIQIVTPPAPLTFTQSMNFLITYGLAQNADVVIFMHNDVELHPGTAESFYAALQKLLHSNKPWGVLFAHGFLLGALRLEAVRQIGLWDIHWPDIFSDYDYCQRIHLAGYDLIDTYLPLTHHNGGSNTIKADPQLFLYTQQMGPRWGEMYERKWGGPPIQERYRMPYDAASTLPPPTSWSQHYKDFRTYF